MRRDGVCISPVYFRNVQNHLLVSNPLDGFYWSKVLGDIYFVLGVKLENWMDQRVYGIKRHIVVGVVSILDMKDADVEVVLQWLGSRWRNQNHLTTESSSFYFSNSTYLSVVNDIEVDTAPALQSLL